MFSVIRVKLNPYNSYYIKVIDDGEIEFDSFDEASAYLDELDINNELDTITECGKYLLTYRIIDRS